MKFKHLLFSLALPVLATNVSAEEFYIDNGVDFDNSKNTDVAVNQNTTGWVTELLYEYSSTTTANCSAVDLTGGCSVTTAGGVDTSGSFLDMVNSLSTNQISDLSPQDTLDMFGPSDNDFGTDWGLTFEFEVSGTIGGAGLITDYTSGYITFYYYDADTLSTLDTSTALVELFTIEIYGTQTTGTGQQLLGMVSSVATGTINGVDIGDIFNVASGSFGELLALEVGIAVSVDYNTDPDLVTITDNGNGTTTLTGEHDGSISFQVVPEPASLAFVGFGLFAMGTYYRRKGRKQA